MFRPKNLIVGPPRSGTTWVRRQLSQNGIGFIPGSKGGELNFYGFKSFDVSLFEGIKEFDKRIDFTPIYLTHQPSLDEILAEKKIQDVKTVAILRDPVERFVSDFFHKRKEHGYTVFGDFEVAAIEEYLNDPAKIHESTHWFSPGKLLSHSFWSANLKELEKSPSHLTLPFELLVRRPEVFMLHITEHFDLKPCSEIQEESVNHSVRTPVNRPSEALTRLLTVEREIVASIGNM